MEAGGDKFYNARGEETDCFALMKQLGLTAIRLRVWVNPEAHGNWCDKEDLLAKARRAADLGMDVMVNFHYSDWWADPGTVGPHHPREPGTDRRTLQGSVLLGARVQARAIPLGCL